MGGGTPLPTPSTPGYTSFRGFTSCVCLAAWLPVLERLALAHGFIKEKLDILQLTGDYALSGGNHREGGVFDIKQYDTRIVALAREMGAPATWLRNMNYADGSPGNTHTHGVLTGCPHNTPAAYQITAQRRGYNGMGQGAPGTAYAGMWGYGGKDPHPDPATYRTHTQGIAWANAQIVKLEDDMYTDADRLTEKNRYIDLVARQNKILAAVGAEVVDVDEAALAVALAAALTGPLSDALAAAVAAKPVGQTLTRADVDAVVRNVFATAGTPPTS